MLVLCVTYPWIMCWIIPGSGWETSVRMMAFVLVLPWLLVPACQPLQDLYHALGDGFRKRSRFPEKSAQVFHILGGLTWVAGLLAMFGAHFTFIIRLAELHLLATASVIPGAVAAMAAPAVFAFLARYLFYESMAATLRHKAESAANQQSLWFQ